MPSNGVNYRLFYAVYQVGMALIGEETFDAVHGAQSVGMNTNFNLEQVFEIGQINIYENIENIPDVEVTIEKILDGYQPVYLMATRGRSSATLTGRSTPKTIIGVSYFPDDQDAASGTPLRQVVMSGMYVSSFSYNFPVEGNFTESVTLIGNNKVWKSGSYTFTGAFDNNDAPRALAGSSGGVNRREDMIFDTNTVSRDVNGMVNATDATILPPIVYGISSSGTNNRDSAGNFGAHLQDITVSTDLGREELFELGRRNTYFRFVTFPIEVTTEITAIATAGDNVSGTEEGVLGNGNNLSDSTIKIQTREGLNIDCGTRNKLASSSETGGDTGGGNRTVTYTFSNFNTCVVTHHYDPQT